MATSSKEIVVTLRLEDKGAVQRLGQLEIETKQFQKELRLLNAEIVKNGQATTQQAEKVGVLTASIRRNQTVIRELKNDLSGATDAGLRFRDKMADAAKAGLGAFGLNILTVAGGVTALVSVFKDGLKTLADFDQALAKVSALGGEYAENIGQIAEVTKTVGIQFGFTAVQSVQAVEALAKAGVAVEDILGGGLEGALTLAAAGTLDVATAAEAAAKAMVQFGLSGQDVTHIADLFANSANKALGEVSDITAALNQSGQVANQFGVSIEETVGTLTAFAQAGLLGSDAGTSFRTMLIRLAKPTDDSAKLMEQLGINAFDAQGAFVGIENLAGQLQSQLKGLTEEQRNSALATIFGTDAIRSASILYEGGAEAIAKWTTEVGEQGEAARIAAEKTNNLVGDVDRLSASYDAAILSGGAFTQILRDAVQGLTADLSALGEAANLFELVASAGQTSFSALLNLRAKLKEEDAAKIFDATKLSTEELTTELQRLKTLRDAFIAQGKLLAAGEGDGKIAVIESALADREAAAALKQAAGETENLTTKTKELTKAEEKAAQATRDANAARAEEKPGVLATRQTPLLSSPLGTPEQILETQNAAEKAAQQFQITQEALRLNEIRGVQDFNDELAALDAEFLAGKLTNLAEYEAEKARIQNNARAAELETQRQLIQAAGDFFGSLSQLAEQGTAEFKALATAQALINTYLGASQALVRPPLDPTPPLVRILQAAAVIAAGLANVAKIQGFAKGGRVEKNGRVTKEWGPRVNRDNGDTVLATLKPNEAVLNEDQQERAKRLYGSDFFRRIGVPGFADGGVATRSRYQYVKGNGGFIPSPRDIVNIEAAAEQRAMEFSPVVSVVEMRRVMNRVKVIEQLASA